MRVLLYWVGGALILSTLFIVFVAFPSLINSQNDGEILLAFIAVGSIATANYFFWKNFGSLLALADEMGDSE